MAEKIALQFQLDIHITILKLKVVVRLQMHFKGIILLNKSHDIESGLENEKQ